MTRLFFAEEELSLVCPKCGSDQPTIRIAYSTEPIMVGINMICDCDNRFNTKLAITSYEGHELIDRPDKSGDQNAKE